MSSHDNRNGVDPLRPLEGSDHVRQQRFAMQAQVLLGNGSAHPPALAGSGYKCDVSNRAGRGLRFWLHHA
jgi:hypothetical protein